MFGWLKTALKVGNKSGGGANNGPPAYTYVEPTQEDLDRMAQDREDRRLEREAALQVRNQRTLTQDEQRYEAFPALAGGRTSLQPQAEALLAQQFDISSAELVAGMVGHFSGTPATPGNTNVVLQDNNNAIQLVVQIKKDHADADAVDTWTRNACALSLNCIVTPGGDDAPAQLYIERLDAISGNCRSFFCGLLDMAMTLDLDQLALDATETGRYAWIRYGFRPTQDSWDNLRKVALVRLASVEQDIEDPDLVTQARGFLNNENPQAIEQVADLRSPLNPNMSLGFFLVSSAIWSGTFDLRDQAAVDKVKAYINYPE